MSASKSKFATRRKSSIFESKTTTKRSVYGKVGGEKKNNNRKKKSATIAINARKRASQYQGSKRYSLTQGRDLNQYRELKMLMLDLQQT